MTKRLIQRLSERGSRAAARAETVVVEGRAVVRGGRLLTADEDEIAREIAATSERLATTN